MLEKLNMHKWALLIIALIISILTHITELLALMGKEADGGLFPGMSAVDVASEMAFAFLSMLLLFLLNLFLLSLKDRLRGYTWIWMIGMWLVSWLACSLLCRGYYFLHVNYSIPAIHASAHQIMHPFKVGVMALVACACCLGLDLYSTSQRIRVENHRLEALVMAHRYEMLRNQLNPHMLFNCLNTLGVLIQEDSALAHKYLKMLSDILRYSLQMGSHASVLLSEEMEYARKYLEILRIRFQENLTVSIQSDDGDMNLRLPPMTLQVLIENAVKHNEVSSQRKLDLRIMVLGRLLMVTNSLQPRNDVSEGSGIGLSNLRQRVLMLTGQEMRITRSQSDFTVTIPLI